MLISIPEWAESSRILPEGTPFPGMWRNEKTPYLVEPMECLSPQSPVTHVTGMKCVQIGFTALAENLIGHTIDVNPGPLLYVTATKELAEDWSSNRLDPLLSLCGLEEKLQLDSSNLDRQRKDKGDRKLSKKFPGGFFRAASYNAAALLRSTSFRVVLLDEVDAAPITVKNEGDPKTIAEARTSAYEGRKKIFIFSTPLVKQTSKVYSSFLEGDQRYYHIACPFCGKYQKLEWRNANSEYNLKYEVIDGQVQEDTVYYECIHCHGKMKNYHKEIFLTLESAKWIPENPKAPEWYRSYSINALYAPPGMITWEKLAVEWEKAKGDNEKLKAFINLRLGEPWVEGSEYVDDEDVLAKRLHYMAGEMPDGVEFTTMGCDVHGDNIQAEILGFGGDNNHTWSIDFIKFEGSTLDPFSGAFFKLRKFIENNHKKYKMRMIFIDSGYSTSNVLKFCERSRKIVPCMGEGLIDRGRSFFKERTSKKNHGQKFIGVGTDSYKQKLMHLFKLQHSVDGEFPFGYPFFPVNYDIKYFRSLNSEAKQPVLSAGRVVRYQWVKIRENNHALDCRVYALCAKDFLFKTICEALELEEVDEKIAWQVIRRGK